VNARMRDALASVMKEAYTAGLGEQPCPTRPSGELVGLTWVRPLKVG
jgi:hypothetical protein